MVEAQVNKTLIITGYNRPEMFKSVLESWEKARGQEDWDAVISLDPSESTETHVEYARAFFERTSFASENLVTWDEHMGVLRHPYAIMDACFERGADYVVRTEDDLPVADDVLEFHAWAASEFETHLNVGSIHAFALDNPQGLGTHDVVQGAFSPLVWGTWRGIWKDVIAPTWDFDYSTYNGAPGNEAGWDWNLKTRIFPEHRLVALSPAQSRANNIGVWGAHGTPENFEPSHCFQEHYEPGTWT